MKEPSNKVENNSFAVVRTNSKRNGMSGAVQQNSSGLYLCFYPCSVALWTYLQLGNASTMEVNADWKSLIFFFFMDQKLATDETKIEENLKKTVKRCLK